MKPQPTFLRIVVEGLIDEAIARRLANLVGFPVGPVFVKRGKDQLDRKLPAYAAASRFGPWLVLRDLDRDASCAPSLVDLLLPERPSNLLLRIPVHAAESWILADQGNLASYLRVAKATLPARPDDLDQPKRELVALASRSRHRLLRRDMSPSVGSKATVGPAYTSRVIEFVSERWEPRQAARRSPSLNGCLTALEKMRIRL